MGGYLRAGLQANFYFFFTKFTYVVLKGFILKFLVRIFDLWRRSKDIGIQTLPCASLNIGHFEFTGPRRFIVLNGELYSFLQENTSSTPRNIKLLLSCWKIRGFFSNHLIFWTNYKLLPGPSDRTGLLCLLFCQVKQPSMGANI